MTVTITRAAWKKFAPGCPAAQDVGYFATAAQGALADSALQSTDVAPTIHAATGRTITAAATSSVVTLVAVSFA